MVLDLACRVHLVHFPMFLEAPLAHRAALVRLKTARSNRVAPRVQPVCSCRIPIRPIV
jgi:hypothetical protein